MKNRVYTEYVTLNKDIELLLLLNACVSNIHLINFVMTLTTRLSAHIGLPVSMVSHFFNCFVQLHRAFSHFTRIAKLYPHFHTSSHTLPFDTVLSHFACYCPTSVALSHSPALSHLTLHTPTSTATIPLHLPLPHFTPPHCPT